MRTQMVFRPARLILILSMMVVSSLCFTNCETHSRSETAEPEVLLNSGTSAYNGGGHSGKLSYLFTSADEDACLYPALGLEVEAGQTRSFTYGCNGTVESGFDAKDLLRLEYDPYFLIYKDRIYAHDSLLKLEKYERAEFQVLCSDSTFESSGLDFAVKYTRNYDPQVLSTKTEALLIRGKTGADPDVMAEVGRMSDPSPKGLQTFRPQSKSYEVQIQRLSATRAEAELSLKPSGTKIRMSCYVKAPNGADPR